MTVQYVRWSGKKIVLVLRLLSVTEITSSGWYDAAPSVNVTLPVVVVVAVSEGEGEGLVVGVGVITDVVGAPAAPGEECCPQLASSARIMSRQTRMSNRSTRTMTHLLSFSTA
jgi:hypothetical protein